MTHRLRAAATARLGVFAAIFCMPLAFCAAEDSGIAVRTFDASGERTQLVADPAAAGKKPLADAQDGIVRRLATLKP